MKEIDSKHASFNSEELSDLNRLENLQVIADYLRKDAFEVIKIAQNGHIGGSSSSIELLTALYFGGQFKFDLENSEHANRDRVLIRGHEGPARYPIFSLLGYIDRKELWTYRRLGSRLQGHEDMQETPGVDITPSGSLGMLLSYGVGAAIASKEQNLSNKTIVFLGDGEEQEGNVSEAARHATSIGLDNLICIIDKNTKQLSRPTAESDSAANLGDIWQGYGWNVIDIKDGHDLAQIMTAYDQLIDIKKPTVVIANTIKGYGVEGSHEHFSGYHTLSAMSDPKLLDKAINNLDERLGERITDSHIQKIGRLLVKSPEAEPLQQTFDDNIFDIRLIGSDPVNMEKGQSQYFTELNHRISANSQSPPFYMITPDLLRSDAVEELELDNFVTKYIDTGLREQHAIAMAHGISTQNPDARVYICYGDAFLYRALDQMNAAASGGSSILVAGENAGLFQGQNGKTHQSVGQPGALMQIPEATVLEPGDVQDLYNVFSDSLLKNNAFTYVRLHRGNVQNLERESTDNNNIDAYTVHRPDKAAKLVIAASGFMVENSVLAARQLETSSGIPTMVLNVINQKTLDQSLPTLLVNEAPVLTVYNGNPVTLQNNVSGAILSNPDIPRPTFVEGHGYIGGTSGKVQELFQHYKLDPMGIQNTALRSLAKYKGKRT